MEIKNKIENFLEIRYWNLLTDNRVLSMVTERSSTPGNTLLLFQTGGFEDKVLNVFKRKDKKR